MPKRRLRRKSGLLRLAAAGWLSLLLGAAGCGYSQPSRFAFVAVEGPELAVAAEQDGRRFTGTLERAAMVGNGKLSIEQPESGLICSGSFNSPPNAKGRVRGIIKCGDGRYLFLNMSLHGPDQGVGVGRFMRLKTELPEKQPDAKPDALTKAGAAAVDGDKAASDEPETLDVEFEQTDDEPLLLFYHPWDQEAARRLHEVRETLGRNLQMPAAKTQ